MINRYKFLFLSCLYSLYLLTHPLQAVEEKPTQLDNRNDFPLYQTEQLCLGLMNERSTWFKLANGMEVGNETYIQLHYLNTPLALPQHSFITVSLNGSPFLF